MLAHVSIRHSTAYFSSNCYQPTNSTLNGRNYYLCPYSMSNKREENKTRATLRWHVHCLKFTKKPVEGILIPLLWLPFFTLPWSSSVSLIKAHYGRDIIIQQEDIMARNIYTSLYVKWLEFISSPGDFSHFHSLRYTEDCFCNPGTD